MRGIARWQTSRIKVGDHSDLWMHRPSKRGGQEGILSCRVEGKSRSRRAGKVARRVPDVGHGEDAKGRCVRRNGEGASAQEGSRHDGGCAGEDPDAGHGAVAARIGVVSVDVTHVGERRGAHHRRQGRRNLRRGDLAVRAHEPFKVMTFSGRGKPQESTASAVSRGPRCDWIEEGAPWYNGRGGARKGQAARGRPLHGVIKGSVDLIVKMHDEQPVTCEAYPSTQGGDDRESPGIGDGEHARVDRHVDHGRGIGRAPDRGGDGTLRQGTQVSLECEEGMHRDDIVIKRGAQT